MNIIAAVDKNWAIGKNNELLVRIPMDQKFFRETTTGKVVVAARRIAEPPPRRHTQVIIAEYRRLWDGENSHP